jgi:hypothetical protein
VPDVQTTDQPLPPMTEDQIGAWRARLSEGRDIAKELVTEGRKHLERYVAKSLPNKPSAHTVVVPLDYASVEQKKAQLFFQVPEMTLESLRPEGELAAPVMTAVTNHVLGPQGVNLKSTMFEMLTDALCPMGYAVAKIGYENTVDGKKPVQVGEEPDLSQMQPGSILGLGPVPMKPVIEQVPNIIHEQYYWRRIPPGFLLVPSDFRGSNFDDAAWLAWRFEEDVPEGTKGSYSSEKDDELLLVPKQQESRHKTPKRCGTEVWYQASRVDPDEKHPKRIRTFKLYDDEPIERERRNSPFQRLSPTGELMGMMGYPLHVLTLRYLSDSAFPPSDSQMGAQMADEISIGRTQLLQKRDRSLQQVLVDGTRVDRTVMQKLERNDNMGFVDVPGNPNEMFLPLNKGDIGRENFAFNQQAQTDYDRTWALGENAGVLPAQGQQTATKSVQVQRSVDTRLEAERTRVLEYVISGAMKLMGCYQLFADTEDYVRIAGPEGETRLQAWDKTTLQFPMVFKARPNSHIKLDAESDFQQELSFFNLAGNAPEGNRTYMLQRLAAKRGLDPMKAIQQPPPKTPEPPKGSFTIKMEDFVLPQGPITVEIATQLGLKISPEAIMLSQQLLLQSEQMAAAEAAEAEAQKGTGETEHGGAMVGGGKTSPINKHSMDRTGGLPNVGVVQ